MLSLELTTTAQSNPGPAQIYDGGRLGDWNERARQESFQNPLPFIAYRMSPRRFSWDSPSILSVVLFWSPPESWDPTVLFRSAYKVWHISPSFIYHAFLSPRNNVSHWSPPEGWDLMVNNGLTCGSWHNFARGRRSLQEGFHCPKFYSLRLAQDGFPTNFCIKEIDFAFRAQHGEVVGL